jgi:hypothetical protein
VRARPHQHTYGQVVDAHGQDAQRVISHVISP